MESSITDSNFEAMLRRLGYTKVHEDPKTVSRQKLEEAERAWWAAAKMQGAQAYNSYQTSPEIQNSNNLYHRNFKAPQNQSSQIAESIAKQKFQADLENSNQKKQMSTLKPTENEEDPVRLSQLHKDSENPALPSPISYKLSSKDDKREDLENDSDSGCSNRVNYEDKTKDDLRISQPVTAQIFAANLLQKLENQFESATQEPSTSNSRDQSIRKEPSLREGGTTDKISPYLSKLSYSADMHRSPRVHESISSVANSNALNATGIRENKILSLKVDTEQTVLGSLNINASNKVSNKDRAKEDLSEAVKTENADEIIQPSLDSQNKVSQLFSSLWKISV